MSASQLASVRDADRLDGRRQRTSRTRQTDAQQHALTGAAVDLRRPARRERVAVARQRPAPAEDESRALDRPTLDLGRQTYLTVRQAADYLGGRSIDAVYKWVRRYHVPSCRMGRSLLFLRRDLDEAVREQRPETAQKGER